ETPLDFDAFINYKINDEIIKLHTTKYWQQNADYVLIDKMTIKEVEAEIIRLKHEKSTFLTACQDEYIKNKFPSIFPEEKFKEIFKVEKCAYCNITIGQINLLIDNGLIYKKRL